MQTTDRRSVKRVVMTIPVMIQRTPEEDNTACLFLQTRDISSNGAYLQTREPLRGSSIIQMAFILKVPLTGKEDNFVCMTTAGKVTRADESGYAVSFTGIYKLIPFQ